MMDNLRAQKTARLIQRAMAALLQQGGVHLGDKVFVTVTEVQVSRSLQEAKLSISTSCAAAPEDCFAALQAQLPYIRWRLGQMLRKELRHIPHLVLLQDRSQTRPSASLSADLPPPD